MCMTGFELEMGNIFCEVSSFCGKNIIEHGPGITQSQLEFCCEFIATVCDTWSVTNGGISAYYPTNTAILWTIIHELDNIASLWPS